MTSTSLPTLPETSTPHTGTWQQLLAKVMQQCVVRAPSDFYALRTLTRELSRLSSERHWLETLLGRLHDEWERVLDVAHASRSALSLTTVAVTSMTTSIAWLREDADDAVRRAVADELANDVGDDARPRPLLAHMRMLATWIARVHARLPVDGKKFVPCEHYPFVEVRC